MIYPSADKIDKEINSKYALVVLAAKRARQLKEGARPLIDTRSANPITVALEEIASGRIKYRFDETSLAGKEALADAEAVVGNRNVESDGSDTVDRAVLEAAAQLGADLSAVIDAEADSDDEVADDEEEDGPLGGLGDDVEVAEE